MSEVDRGRIPRWYGATVATLSLAVVGIFLGRGEFLVAASVPLVYVAASSLSGVDDLAVEVTRSASAERAIPGERVTVTLEVRNAGDEVLVDLRLVDGVPDQLEVVAGSPRACVGLRPGETRSLEYEVVATRGDHPFDPPRVRARSLSGSSIVTGDAAVTGTTELVCELQLDEMVLHGDTVAYVGQVPADETGSGIEFYSTREYRTTDPLNRIDWRRFAKTGELSTVQFREDRSAVVVFVVDARRVTNLAAGPGEPTARELGLYAVERAIATLRREGNRVGVAAIGGDADGEYVEPTRSRSVEAGFADVARMVADGSGDGAARGASVDAVRTGEGEGDGPAKDAEVGPPRRHRDVDALRRRLPGFAQVVLVSPVLDDFPLEVVDTLRAHGHAVSVLSPDVTGGETPGKRMGHLRRDLRLVELRERGAAIVDWDVSEPLSMAIADTVRRWLER